MLAATVLTESDIPGFPLLVTPKIDGVRALKIGNVLVSRSLKPIPNRRIRDMLELLLPEGADGEIFCPPGLHTTTSLVMSHEAEGTDWMFYWFDWAYCSDVPYCDRVLSIAAYVRANSGPLSGHVSPLMPHSVNNINELYEFEEQALSQGSEGIMLRAPNGRYKYGRSTLREGLMVKLKRFKDSEAKIIGTEELVHDSGVAGEVLGAITAVADNGETFKIGTGYTADQRLALWMNRSAIIGMTVKYKHDMVRGSRGRPRCPVFLGIRHDDDA